MTDCAGTSAEESKEKKPHRGSEEEHLCRVCGPGLFTQCNLRIALLKLCFRFGGFTSSNKSAEEAFSFLGKPKADEKKDDVVESKGASAEKNDDVSKPDDLMAKFMKKSGWSCEVCMINNNADMVKCVACETPKPGGGGAAVSGSPMKSVSQPSPAAAADPLMAKFMMKGADSSKWSCEVCMISNPADKTKCVACETPNPKASASTPTASTNNEAEKEATPTFNFGSGGGFKLADSAANKTESTFSNFKFGSTASQPAEPEPLAVGGFKFGAATEASAPTTGGFKFGASPSDAHSSVADQVSGFKFGNSSEDASSTTTPVTGFKFGATEASNAPSSGFFTTKSNGSSPFQGPTGFLFSSTEKVRKSLSSYFCFLLINRTFSILSLSIFSAWQK